MPVLTTTIGAYPKPDFVAIPDWFRSETTHLYTTRAYDAFAKLHTAELHGLLDKGTQDAVLDQVNAGIDVPTDGEIRRENYIHYHCRHLAGYDFNVLTERTDMRNGAWRSHVPTVTGPIAAGDAFLPADWTVAQAVTDKPVKITIPGPITIMDSTANRYYANAREWGAALANAINREVLALATAGCRWIQIDEPVFARNPEQALSFGVALLDRCFDGLPNGVVSAVHLCCGYPDRVDNEDYAKADRNVYFELAAALERSTVQAISLEDAHRHNDLTLLERYPTKTIILGVVAIARSRVEAVAEIEARLQAALHHIDAARLMAAPDCGLGMLDRKTAIAKMTNLAEAARLVG